jgi:hypothetical protein
MSNIGTSKEVARQRPGDYYLTMHKYERTTEGGELNVR